VQQYEEHLGSIDTLTFLENGKRFVSTSDDKKIFVWEFGIPVVAKHISEPDMHAVPATTMHPNGKYFAGQSMDNKIVIYDVKHGNFKLNRKKKFTGHINSGYACGLKFSPDG
jgi:pre-mRNA-processing factor 17